MFIKDGDLLILHSNPFRFLYLTAKSYIQKAEQAKLKNDKESERDYSMAAIILLTLSVEALINRIYEELIRDNLPNRIYREIMDKWSPTMKWYFAPLLFGQSPDKTFKIDREPWQSFFELKKVRDYIAHLKPLKYIMVVKDAKEKIFDFHGDIPKWRQTKIPKDLNHFQTTDAKRVLDIIDQTIEKIDFLMQGKIKRNKWYLTEKIEKKEDE